MDVRKKEACRVLADCLTLAFLTGILWCVILAVHGIFPFGTKMMDVGDMAEQSVPVYTHLWDVLHGKESFFFDWNTGLGDNMCGANWHFGLISPFNLFFLLIPRSMVEASMSFYLLGKLAAISLSMRFAVKKWFPGLPQAMRSSLCLLYTFSAFSMGYYYAPMWLDVVFMFPLVMYTYFRLFTCKKECAYSVCLALACMMSFQHTYMLALLLLFLTGFLLLLGKDRYRDCLWIFLRGTAAAVLLSAWVWLPGVLQIMGANRVTHNNGLWDIYHSIWVFYADKWVKLVNMGIPLSLFGLYAKKNGREKGVRFFVYVAGLLSAPILLESSNLLWHGGSYESFTMRFSYMLAFWVIMAGAYGYTGLESACGERHGARLSRRAGGWRFLLGAVSCLVMAGVLALQHVWLGQGITAPQVVFVVLLVALSNAVLVSLSIRSYGKVILAAVALQSLVLGINMVHTSWDRGDSFATESNRIQREDAEKNPLSRSKSMDILLTHNYPLIMGKNAMSNYLAVISPEQMETVLALGYAKVGDRMSDYGGTLFSDALLGIREVVVRSEPNPDLYVLQDSWQRHSIYDSRYYYKTGILLSGLPKDAPSGYPDPFSWQNYLAEAVTGKALLKTGFADQNRMEVCVGEKSVLYLYSKQIAAADSIAVTDRATGKTVETVLHPSDWENGIIELGTYENTTVDIWVSANRELGRIHTALLSLQDFADNPPVYGEKITYTFGAHDMSLCMEGAGEGTYLFLPLYADEGWHCSVNGKKTRIETAAGACMAIPLTAGKNEIRLVFWPVGWKPGIAAAMAGAVGLLALALRDRREKKTYPALNRCLFWVLEVVYAALLLFFYILPVWGLLDFAVRRFV